jgi:hypothetical protein
MAKYNEQFEISLLAAPAHARHPPKGRVVLTRNDNCHSWLSCERFLNRRLLTRSARRYRDVGTPKVPYADNRSVRQYAKEALLSAGEAKTEDDRQSFLELARTWTQAALAERRSPIDHDGSAA